jgi:hypothetical protein
VREGCDTVKAWSRGASTLLVARFGLTVCSPKTWCGKKSQNDATTNQKQSCTFSQDQYRKNAIKHNHHQYGDLDFLELPRLSITRQSHRFSVFVISSIVKSGFLNRFHGGRVPLPSKPISLRLTTILNRRPFVIFGKALL